MKRREFLRQLLAAPLAAGTFLYGNPGWLQLQAATASNGKSLIVIFQRGGCDGLNSVIPYADPDYYALRPTISVSPPGTGGALDLDGFFGLHPGLAPLHEIYAEGSLAVLPAVHYSGAPLSHFDSQYLIESGSPSGAVDGWLNRYLAARPGEATLRAAAFGVSLPHAFSGAAQVATLGDLGDLGFGGSAEEVEAFTRRFRAIYGQAVNPAELNRARLHASGMTLLESIDALGAIDTEAYQPADGVEYPDTVFGRQLRQTAQLIKEGAGLELAAIDIGGWDTHSGQGGADPAGLQARRHAEFASGIAALYRDLGQTMDDVVILTMTEFGRTARENASRGTDHGKAGAWYVIGGGVNGGVHGEWPGLAEHQLVKGRYLDHSIDFRDVMAELLTEHLSLDRPDAVLRGYSHTPIGLFG